jgi:hypothetical protein
LMHQDPVQMTGLGQGLPKRMHTAWSPTTSYHAWVYHFKIEYPSNTLLTEYEKIEHHEDQGDDNDQQEIEIKLFCGDLDLAECKILVPNERNDDFKLLLSSGPNVDPVVREAARVHD